MNDAGSVAAVAAQARVSEGAVRMWLSRVEPTREKLAAIAKATGVTLDWLIAGRGPKIYSEGPPGYVMMRFADLTQTKGVPGRPFFATKKVIFLPLFLFGMTETEGEQLDPMALLLPPEKADLNLADFVVFDFTQEGETPPRPGVLCVDLADDGRASVRPARSSAGVTDMSEPILGPVIFRGSILRSKVVQKAKERGTKPQ